MKKIIVTTSWDDGHVLDLKLARLLKKYSIKGTFYIPPRNREFPRSELLTDREVVRLSEDFEIGGHTMTHPVLTKINLAKTEKEIIEGKQYLEKLIGRKLISFSYPRGKHNSAIQKLVKKSGFLYARTIQRHKFTMLKNVYASPTSLHAMNQYQDLIRIARFSGWRSMTLLKNINWENLSKAMFDYVLEIGGIFHFWGHSWLIEQHKDWDKLDRVLAYISDNKKTMYVENKELPYLD